jgi:hypothetical protein
MAVGAWQEQRKAKKNTGDKWDDFAKNLANTLLFSRKSDILVYRRRRLGRLA